MTKKYKKLITLTLLFLLFLPLELEKTTDAATLTKTIEFFIGQDSVVRDNSSSFYFDLNNISIPETNPVIKSAIIEISGVSYNDTGNQIINVDFQQNTNSAGTGTDYVLNRTSKARNFLLKYNALNTINPSILNYRLYLNGTATGKKSFSIFSAKLILTYEYSNLTNEFLRTSKFFVKQENEKITSDVQINKNFTITVSGVEPIIQSAFIEINGVAKGRDIGIIKVSVTGKGLQENFINYNLDLSPVNSNTKFTIKHDVSSDIIFSNPGNKNYTLSFKGIGFDTNILNAEAIITYKYKKNVSNLPISGYLISSTIDTGMSQGVAFNSFLWKGNLNGGKVQLQLATSDSILGPWNKANFLGPDCTSSTYYTANSNIPIEINCFSNHNNKQYFKYKIVLCSNITCANNGIGNPEVTDIIVNWSS